MGKLLSGTAAIPSILTLVVLAVMIAFQDYYTVAYALGLIAFIWFGAFLLYLRQSLSIDLKLCEIDNIHGTIRIALEGFIWSRHPDGLSDLELFIIPQFGIGTSEGLSDIPHSIDNKPQKFRAGYDVSVDLLKLAVKEQGTDGVNISFILYAKMRSRDILYQGFIISPFLVLEEGLQGLTIEMDVKMKGHKREKKGIGIDPKQFHKILDKASQPIRKSEKEKS